MNESMDNAGQRPRDDRGIEHTPRPRPRLPARDRGVVDGMVVGVLDAQWPDSLPDGEAGSGEEGGWPHRVVDLHGQLGGIARSPASGLPNRPEGWLCPPFQVRRKSALPKSDLPAINVADRDSATGRDKGGERSTSLPPHHVEQRFQRSPPRPGALMGLVLRPST